MQRCVSLKFGTKKRCCDGQSSKGGGDAPASFLSTGVTSCHSHFLHMTPTLSHYFTTTLLFMTPTLSNASSADPARTHTHTHGQTCGSQIVIVTLGHTHICCAQIGNYTIKLSMLNKDSKWTKSLKLMLANLKVGEQLLRPCKVFRLVARQEGWQIPRCRAEACRYQR